jgi:hypothetical protein
MRLQDDTALPAPIVMERQDQALEGLGFFARHQSKQGWKKVGGP